MSVELTSVTAVALKLEGKKYASVLSKLRQTGSGIILMHDRMCFGIVWFGAGTTPGSDNGLRTVVGDMLSLCEFAT